MSSGTLNSSVIVMAISSGYSLAVPWELIIVGIPAPKTSRTALEFSPLENFLSCIAPSTLVNHCLYSSSGTRPARTTLSCNSSSKISV